MSMFGSFGLPVVAGGLVALAVTGGALATEDAVAQFYRGKQITVLIGSSPGGGYDLYARLIARHLGKYIPGNPSIVPSNMPGAGSHTAAGHIYAVAPKDGTVIGALQSGVVFEPLLAARTFNHDPTKFNYLGSANDDVYICIARTDAPVSTFKEVFTRELILGGSPSSSPTDNPIFLNNVIGTKFKVITGYPGTREIGIAIDRNEVQGACGVAWPSISVTNPGWFKDGKMRVLVQTHQAGHPDLNKEGVPRANEFARTPEERTMIDLYFSQTEFGRPYLVAPDVPKERVEALRKAFQEALRDPQLMAEANKIGIEMNQVSGERLQELVAKIFSSPPDLIAKMRQALIPKT
jgi:tripartite-type tricarboxylate transporter receptor subunit TctC